MPDIITAYTTDAGTDTSQEYLTKPWTTKQNFMAGKKQLNIVTPDTVKSLFLYNINTKETIDLKLIPDQMAESYSQKIVSESPFGIVHPINFYTGGNEKSLSFNFDLHEDLNNIGGSIYTLIDKMKSLSNSVITNDLQLKPPLIYFQLGDQFAGKGHITTSFSYKKPFTNGRYKLISCSVSFVFHEVFESPDIALGENQSAIYSTTNVSAFTDVDLAGTKFNGMSVDDFYEQNFDYDYIKNYLFTETKISEVFNLISGPLATLNLGNFGITGYNNGVTQEQFIALMTSNLPQDQDVIQTIISKSVTQYYTYQDPFRTDLIVILYNFLKLIQSPYNANMIGSLSVILDNLNKLKETYLASTSDTPKTLYIDSPPMTIEYYDHGYYTVYPRSSTAKTYQLSLEERKIFERTLGVNIDIGSPKHDSGLLQIVQKIIDAYSVLRGAGA